MRKYISQTILASLILVIAFAGTADAQDKPFNVQLSWVAQDNPMVFSIGKLIPGDLSNPDNINFEDLSPFFRVLITPNGDVDLSERFVLWIRMSDSSGDPIFTIFTDRVEANRMVGRWMTNTDIATDLPLDTDVDLGPEDLLPYLDGGNLREGYYEVTAYITERGRVHVDAGDDVSGLDHLGVGTLSLWARNPNQVELIQPAFGAVTQTDVVTFTWNFPRQPGVKFNLKVVSAEDEDDDPWTAIETYGSNPSDPNFYANLTFDVEDNAGEQTSYTFTGTGETRPLQVNKTYFWQVTAQAPTMFDNDEITIYSSVFSFDYTDGQGGELGGGEEGAPPRPEAPIFTLLRQTLSYDDFNSVKTSLEAVNQLNAWSRVEGGILIEGYPVSMDELSRFLLLGGHTVTLSGVEQ